MVKCNFGNLVLVLGSRPIKEEVIRILAVKKVSSHEEFKGNFWLDWELWDLGGAVGVADLV